jgi:hypothetical protein
MDIDKLLALGFDVVAGQIDREGANYGFLTADGAVLTPAGEELVKSLTKKPRKGAAVVEEPAAEPAPEAAPDAPAA